jgi:hypothetical protein
LEFPAFSPDLNYIVKGAPVTIVDAPPTVFEVITSDDQILPNIFSGILDPTQGINIRVRTIQNQPVRAGFMVEISIVP